MTFIVEREPLTTRFSGKAPVSMAQGRHGELIIVQGGGVRPARWSGEGVAVDAGMDAPKDAPGVAVSGPASYYIARVDVTKPGACYYAPPVVTFSGAQPGRPAKAASYLSQAGVSEILVTDGGKGYTEAPSVELSDTHGKGGEIVAVLEGAPTTEEPQKPCNNKKTGITKWEIVSAGSTESNYAAIQGAVIDLPISGNGTFYREMPFWVKNAAQSGYTCTIGGATGVFGYTKTLMYKVSGMSSGSCAILRLEWSGSTFIGQCSGTLGSFPPFHNGAGIVTKATSFQAGEGFADDDKVRVTILPVYGSTPSGLQQEVVIEGMTLGNEDNADAPRYPVGELVVKSPGSGYLVAPQLKFVSRTGFGAYGTCKVSGGKIISATLENSGGGYTTPPTVEILAGGAEAFAVARPHLRGKYQCYYRYVDDTPEDRGGPIPSNLSPVKEIDAGEGATSVTWTIAAPVGRAAKAELWRSTGNQATTLYRVTSTASGSFSDSLTDDELRDPERDGYAAMPIVLPNGEVNANRFGVPPSDKAVVVRFQDRMWYGVDTGGKQPNTIYYSETDEPESVPDTNEIVLQQNARDSDRLKAMIPFGAVLLLMQERRSYSLSFAKNPVLDAQVTPLAYRGCLNQRCWDIYGGVCYILDQYGIYSITPMGQIESISDQIDDLFRYHVDYSKCEWAFLLVDAKTKTLRAFLSFREDGSTGYPTRALCYSLDTKSWWVEKHPQRISGGTQARLSNGDFRCVYAGQSGPVLLDEGFADLGRGAVVSVNLVSGGTGYRTPPKVTASGGCGAQFQASINKDGSVTAVWIVSPGYGYSGGDLTISPPDDKSIPDAVPASATFTATPTSSDTALFPTYRFKGGCAEFITEAINPEAGGELSRNISLQYEPQPVPSDVSLRAYYNNSPSPRPNIAARNRGIGFAHSTVDAAARYDMAAATERTGEDTGIASALFAGKTLADIKSGDRSVAVELVGARKSAHPLVFYGIDINGTVEPK